MVVNAGVPREFQFVGEIGLGLRRFALLRAFGLLRG